MFVIPNIFHYLPKLCLKKYFIKSLDMLFILFFKCKLITHSILFLLKSSDYQTTYNAMICMYKQINRVTFNICIINNILFEIKINKQQLTYYYIDTWE